ncbi:MAG: Cu+-exporting ATPase [Moritella sp.]|jgi:Cu+-exporting ATPase
MQKTLSIHVDGMSCAGCATKLEVALNTHSGIDAKVNFALATALICLTAPADSHNVKSILDHKNYRYEVETMTLAIDGWSCANCAAKTVTKLLENKNVLTAEANFATSQVVVTAFSGALLPAELINTVAKLGYKPSLFNAYTVSQRETLLARKKAFKRKNKLELVLVIISALLTLPLVAGMFTMFIDGFTVGVPAWLQFVLATPVQFIIGGRYYAGAYRSLKNAAANMDVLVATGTSAAYFYSLYLFLTLGAQAMGELYFEASAVVITLITLGKYLEENAKQSTSSAINELMMLRPSTAMVNRADQWLNLPVDDVVLGDQVRVVAGEKVPVDGLIISGQSELDESMITGESFPVFKSEGQRIIGGSINGTGVLVIQVDAVGKDTSLNKIISMVEAAQMAKAPFQQLVDKVSNIFVPVVLVIALITFLTWYWLFNDFESGLTAAVAVLVIACPCALGLATPAAVVTGTGAAARHGILIKDIDTLQKAHMITDVMLDKTGTLTQGTPKVVAIHSFDYEKSKLMNIVGSIQQVSEHPLAKAIVSYAFEHGQTLSPVLQVQTLVGYGIKGRVGEMDVIIGNRELIHKQGINTSVAEEALVELDIHGQTGMWVAIDGRLVGLLAIADTIRIESKAAITLLQRRNINTTVLSGDAPTAVKSIAELLHIDSYYAQVKPEDKAHYVQMCQQRGGIVAMVGDGINDAPALAQADISIAMGSGTDVAMETANITLLRNDPRLVSAAMGISKITWRKIKQNLFWAFIFNIIGIPLAAMGYLSPEIAGAAMAFSSITVLSNSLLIKFWKPKFND